MLCGDADEGGAPQGRRRSRRQPTRRVGTPAEGGDCGAPYQHEKSSGESPELSYLYPYWR